MEWQPIDTAPQVPADARPGDTGPYILLANRFGVWVGVHRPRYTSGFTPENPWVPMLLSNRHMPRDANLVPTHWMPLPEAPDEA